MCGLDYLAPASVVGLAPTMRGSRESRAYTGAETRALSTQYSPALAVTVGVLVGTLLVAGDLGGTDVELFLHEGCETGPLAGGGTYWTPYELVNAPYNGRTTYNATFVLYDLFGRTVITASNGSLGGGDLSTGYFETEYWSVYLESNVTKPGPGLNDPCRVRYVAVPSAPSFNVGVDPYLQGPGNTSNVNEPTTFDDNDSESEYSIPPASFANGFVAANMAPVITCGGHAAELNFTSESFEMGLTLATAGGPISVVVTIQSSQNFTYLFPANGGTWLLDDLEANPGLTGPGLAFEWLPCP